MQFPSTATIVQQKLGIANGCPAFDVQAVCAGFMYAMTTANAYIKSGMVKNALVIGAETFSRIVDWNDRTTCVLFGDGAGAVVLSASDEPGIIHSKLKADGNYLDLLNVPGQIANGQVCGSPYVKMDGPGVFKFAVKCSQNRRRSHQRGRLYRRSNRLARAAPSQQTHHRRHRKTLGIEYGKSHPDRTGTRQHIRRVHPARA